jgi:hypothetical protein
LRDETDDAMAAARGQREHIQVEPGSSDYHTYVAVLSPIQMRSPGVYIGPGPLIVLVEGRLDFAEMVVCPDRKFTF